MYKRVYGFCPTQNKDYSIRVNYINVSTTERFEYAKGIASCDYTSCGNDCDLPRCPIASNAPESISG